MFLSIKKRLELIQSHAFDTDDYILNCKNGILNLKTFELMPHDPKRLITKQIATNYDPNATCPLWKQFINDIFLGDQELIKFVQRVVNVNPTINTRPDLVRIVKRLSGTVSYYNTQIYIFCQHFFIHTGEHHTLQFFYTQYKLWH